MGQLATLTLFWELRLHSNDVVARNILSMSNRRETVLAVHGNADGYWYIGAGRSIAEGPYRNPDQLLSVASDLLAAEPHWRIDVFDTAGNKIITTAAMNWQPAICTRFAGISGIGSRPAPLVH